MNLSHTSDLVKEQLCIITYRFNGIIWLAKEDIHMDISKLTIYWPISAWSLLFRATYTELSSNHAT